MINSVLELEPAPPEPKRCNLMLHQGASLVSRSEVAETPTPRATNSWQPIPHLTVLQVVEKALLRGGLRVTGQSHGLTHDSSRYFGLLEIDTRSSESSWVVGIRNAHDKRFAAGIVAGAQILVCDNLCFSGEVALARKHTTNILRDLPLLANEAVPTVYGHWKEHAARVERYQEVSIGDVRAHDLIVRSVDEGVMANSYIPKVLDEWREPRHEAFREKTVWSLQNAYTEVFKGRVDLLPERTLRLHRLLDHEVGLLN
jgi:hypothetical protein